MVTWEVSADIVTMNDDGTEPDLPLRKFALQPGTCCQPAPDRRRAAVEAGTGHRRRPPCTENGEMALGKNLLVAFMPWRATTTRTRSS